MNFDNFFHTIDEDARNRVAIPHDQARASYPLSSTTVNNWPEFEHYLGDYFCHHCRVVGGGDFGDVSQNLAEAKTLAMSGAGRNTTIKKLFRDSESGADGGLRQVLDHLANGIKQKFLERYISDKFDAYLSPCNIDEATELMRQFFEKYQHILPTSIDFGKPMYYAANFKEYLNLFAQSMVSVASEFRRL